MRGEGPEACRHQVAHLKTKFTPAGVNFVLVAHFSDRLLGGKRATSQIPCPGGGPRTQFLSKYTLLQEKLYYECGS